MYMHPHIIVMMRDGDAGRRGHKADRDSLGRCRDSL